MNGRQKISREELASMIDHTLLKPEATSDEIERLCVEAVEHRFASVCINPCHTALAKEKVANSGVKVCTVIGFPLGATTTTSKVRDTEEALENGSQEIDMVINVGKVKSGDDRYVEDEIRAIADVSHSRSAILKVIIETCLLSDAEKDRACLMARSAGADYVKTSTGFSKGGATPADVALMKRVVGESIGVKASGGIRSYHDAVLMIQSGASRIGTSSGVKIISEAEGQ